MFYVPAVSGMLFQEVLELQVQSMIDSKNGGRLGYSNVCGLMVYLYMIKRLELIGNGKRWMALLQRHRLGEKSTGPNPTDRSKSGAKRSLLVDGKGIPLGMIVDGANRHDMKMTEAYELLEDYGYTIHICLRGEHRVNCKRIPGYRARHWVVERTHS
jgi:hypothetical protein